MTYDAVIVGAGIVGAACAHRLAREEGWRILILEAAETAVGATAAGMGHIVVMDDSEAQFSLTSYSRQLWHKMSERLPASSEFEKCGTIWVAADAGEMSEVQRKKEFYGRRGIKAEILDEQSLRTAEPHLRPGLAGGLLVPEDGVVYQLSATRFFLSEAVESGAELKTSTPVLEISDGGVKLEKDRFISAGKIIIAAGLESVNLISSLKIRRRKGHLVITERARGFVRHQLVELGYLKSAHSSLEDSVAFNVQPRLTGQILIGSSRQFSVADKAVDYNIIRRMISRAFEFMPDLAGLSAIRTWTGFRPATPDNLPYIGRCPGFNNVYLATGHEGLGITTSLGTAELLADEILGRDSMISREPFTPGRLFPGEING